MLDKNVINAIKEVFKSNNFNELITVNELENKVNILLKNESYSIGGFKEGCFGFLYHTKPSSFSIIDLLPLLSKYNVNVHDLNKKIGDIKIELRKDGPENVYLIKKDYLLNRAIEQLDKKLKNLENNKKDFSDDVLFEEEYARIRNEKEKYKNINVDLDNEMCKCFGVYIHSERKIIMYVDLVDITMFISVLAHELLHAYHANKNKYISKKWDKINIDQRVTIESLATFNEILVMEILDKNLAKYKVRELRSYCLPRIWPYSGYFGIKKFVDYLGNDIKNQNKFINELFDNKLEYHDEEIIYYTER